MKTVVDTSEGPGLSLAREILLVAVISSAQLLTQAGLGQVIAPIHVIGSSFGASTGGQLSWYAAAYSLTVGTLILPAGRWGDLFGHRKLFIIGYFWFSLWSILAGISVYSNEVFFDICRAFQGMGPALLLPNAIAILGQAYPPGPRKAMVFSIFGSTAPGGFVLGAVFSGIFAELAWWPWAFWVMGITCFMVGTLSIFAIPDLPRDDLPSDLISRLDLPGTAAGLAGMILFNFAWNQGASVGWTTPYTYALLIVGIFLMAVFFVIERRSPYPLLPLASLSADTALVFGCISAGWSSFGIWVFYLWQFLEVERQNSILSSAAQCVPAAISGACAAITTGYLISRLPAGCVMLASMTFFTVGLILLATAPVNQIYWAQTFVSIVVMPWGMVSPPSTPID